MKYTYLFLVLIALATSCSKADDASVNNESGLEDSNPQVETPLVADFSLESEVVSEGDVLSITNLSSEEVTYKWIFGSNNETSTEMSPNHAFGVHGFYDITLTVNQNNKEASVTKTVEVLCHFGGGNHEPVEADF